jgi:uracil-DNA glycosylase family 4
MEPQGEQADFELRHWDGSDEEDAIEGEWAEDKWLRLLDLYGEIEDEPKWSYLRGPGIRLIKGDGPETVEHAGVMIVGEGPGAVDNGAGKPFSGAAGEILDQCLEVAGLNRSQCFLTNVLKYRSRDNRPPGIGEALMAQDAMRKEWSIVDPILTIAIGSAAHYILNPASGGLALMNFPHGELWTYPRREGIYVTSMIPPALGLRHARYRDAIEGSWTVLGNMIDDLGIRSLLL